MTYWREEPFEVDGVLEGSWGKWALEVKTGPFDAVQLRGLAELTRRHPEHRGLVLRGEQGAEAADRAGFESLPWGEFLLGGPPGVGRRRGVKGRGRRRAGR